MDQVIQAAWGLAAAVVSVLGGFAVQALREYMQGLAQRRLGEAASRVAGEIVAEVQGNPGVQAATDAMVAAGAAALKARLPQAVAKVSASDATLQSMVAGEIGKLGAAVVR